MTERVSVKRKFFEVPHPVAEIVAGALFIVMGFILAPQLGPAGHRVVLDPFTQSAPVWIVEALMTVVGAVLIVQGVGTLARRAR